jgi:para-aminobenzoate synthetase component 1
MDAPLVRPLPFVEPLLAFQPFAGDPAAVLFDAVPGTRGRYAYLCVSPFATLCARGEETRRDGQEIGGNPFERLAELLAPFRQRAVPGLPPFQGGAAGLLGYELAPHLERLPAPWPDDLGAPDLFVGLYDVIAAFDMARGAAWIVSTGFPARGAARRARARMRADWLACRLAEVKALPPLPVAPSGGWRAEVTAATYESRVVQALELIRAGDIFQANLSQRFHAALPAALSPLALYRRLRAAAPAPFAAYAALGGDAWLLSASPERFLSLSAEGDVATCPIKGTRPRRADPARDAAEAAALLASAKDRAENLMIVDLMRNDLARVCRSGSVRVPRLCALESFATVHHLVSTVTGRLRPDRGPVDLLRAAFPGGSVTGAPKIRAMEIIHALEGVRRGPYCGALCWIGFDGAMDSSILIRGLTIGRHGVTAQAGGGIVADSEPAAEYAESRLKAAALLESLGRMAAA